MMFKARGSTSAFLLKCAKPSKSVSAVACCLIANSSSILVRLEKFSISSRETLANSKSRPLLLE